MKKFLNVLLCLLFFCTSVAFANDDIEESITESDKPAEEINPDIIQADKATQIIEMEDNKINIIVMKQPLNEKSNQRITLKRNWLGVYVQINGKVKVNPLTSTYEVE